MALPSRPMHVPAGLPFDEATRPEILDVGKANVANRNVRINEIGALEKRLGFAAMTSDLLDGSTRTAGRRLFVHDDVPCVIDGSYLDAYAEVAAKWLHVARVPECAYRERALPTFSGQGILTDLETCSGFLAAIVADDVPGQPRAVVIDAVTGAVVAPFAALGTPGTSYYTYVASFGTRFVAFLHAPGGGTIDAWIFDTAAPATGWTLLAAVAASGVATAPPSVCSISDRVAITYGTTSGASRVTVKTFNAAGLVETLAITAGTTPVALDCDASDVIWIAWAYGGTVYATARSISSLATVIGSAQPWEDYGGTLSDMRVCAGTTAHTARGFVHDSAGPAANGSVDMVALSISGGGAVAFVSAGRVYNAMPSSRPFCRNDRYYMTCAPSPSNTGVDGNHQALCVLVDWSEDDTGTWRPIANVAPGLVPIASRTAKVCAIETTNVWAVGIQVIKRGDGANAGGGAALACSLIEVSFVDRDRWETAEHQGLTYLGGGLLATFDGVRVTESGFLSRPLKPTMAQSGTGITGTFRWVAIYEDVDALGNVVVSGISDPTDATDVADKTVTLKVPPLSVSARYTTDAIFAPRVAFYRTIDGGSPPYYRVGATAIDPLTDSVTLADSTDDDTLAARPKLYAPSLPSTVGESLDRRPPPGLRHIVSYAGMLVGAKGSSLFWSGQEVYGESTWFSPVFELPISGAGEITALAAQDGALVAFTESRIYVLAGESPSDNGAAGGLGTPRLLASDVGCIDANSVVVCALGIFFQSPRGIEILTRSQSVEWIGEPIQDTLAAYPNMTSAVLDERGALVRFSLAKSLAADGSVSPYVPYFDSGSQEEGYTPTPESGGGRDLVYDTVVKDWISVDDKTDGAINTASQHACYLSDGYAWLASNGVVHLETDGWLDDGAWISSSFTLPPWKLGLQQDHRIFEMMLLFEKRSATGLTIDVAEDYGAFGAVTPAKVWTEAEITAAVVDAPQVTLVPRETGFATQLRISDTAPAVLGTGAGFIWIGMSADIAPKQGATRGTPRTSSEHRR